MGATANPLRTQCCIFAALPCAYWPGCGLVLASGRVDAFGGLAVTPVTSDGMGDKMWSDDTRETIIYNVFQWRRILRISETDLAQRIGISVEEFRLRMRGDKDFTLIELNLIAKRIGETIPKFEVSELFERAEAVDKESGVTIIRVRKQ